MKKRIELPPYREDATVRPRLKCADGTTLSVQASEYHYCHPRETQRGPDPLYWKVEVGYIEDSNKKRVQPPKEWEEYADGEADKASVWGYIPMKLVEDFIEQHGGLKDENCISQPSEDNED